MMGLTMAVKGTPTEDQIREPGTYTGIWEDDLNGRIRWWQAKRQNGTDFWIGKDMPQITQRIVAKTREVAK